MPFGDPRLPDRFWQRIQVDATGCWNWQRPNQQGYGVIRYGTKVRQAHRLAYETLVGPITEQTLDHECHNRDSSCPGGTGCLHRSCVNPAHLVPKSHVENIRASRHTWAGSLDVRERCRNGHLWSENTMRPPSRKGRTCRACFRNRQRAKYATERGRQQAQERKRRYRDRQRALNPPLPQEQTMCRNGLHPRTPENTYTSGSFATCGPCFKVSQARAYEKQKAKREAAKRASKQPR